MKYKFDVVFLTMQIRPCVIKTCARIHCYGYGIMGFRANIHKQVEDLLLCSFMITIIFSGTCHYSEQLSCNEVEQILTKFDKFSFE